MPDWIDNPNANPDNEFEIPKAEPQQSKARFIEDVDGMIHNLKYITSINKKHDTFYVLCEGWHTAKEEFTDEVIQQLGIEVV